MIFCTFAGHREIFEQNIEEQIRIVIESILMTDSKFVFYSGNMGEFDKKCSSAVRYAKRSHPELDISLVAVLPYMMNCINTDRDYYNDCFDDIIIPVELAGVYYKTAILRRNKWLVDHCDFLIAYVYHEFGGAYTTLKYAVQKEKKIINLAELCKKQFGVL